ncbi:MAG: response regulator [Elusimicrobia bacterium]|nr:response regulator [Elusimicrobiota bacterium]MBU2615452.1 response regulator [Elusimicrobiota bacterium]
MNYESINNGADAVSLLRKCNFDVVVTDLSMPIMSGEDLLTVIKNRKRNSC